MVEKKKSDIITIMGLDAGTKNYGYAVVSFKKKGNTVKYKIRECGKLNNLIADLKQPHKPELKVHLKEIKDKIKLYKVDYILAERFMARGNRQTTIECVNQMLGALDASISQEVTQIPAATWKNRANRFFDLKEFYKFCYRVEPHEIDAIFQAVWLYEKKESVEAFNLFSQKNTRDLLWEEVQRKTTSQLKKERKLKK